MQAPRGAQLTGTNSPIDLISIVDRNNFERRFSSHRLSDALSDSAIGKGMHGYPVFKGRKPQDGKEFGGDGAEGTPGTIPNPEVKLRRGDDRGVAP